MVTAAPCRASSRLIPWPMPLSPPATTAALPSSDIVIPPCVWFVWIWNVRRRPAWSHREPSVLPGAGCGPGRDAPGAREGLARFEADQRLTGLEGIRGAGHWLDREAAPVDVRQDVAARQLDERICAVEPQRDLRSGRIRQLHPSQPVRVPL